jgi:hypothetical protein
MLPSKGLAGNKTNKGEIKGDLVEKETKKRVNKS